MPAKVINIGNIEQRAMGAGQKFPEVKATHT